MSVTDAIGDMLTRIRNANKANFADVEVPYSIINEKILQVLLQEGFIGSVEKIKPENKKFSVLKVSLKYGPNGEKVLKELKRMSTPGRRFYLGQLEVPRYKHGYGTYILTTSKGILSGREARMKKVGGEVICRVS